MSYSARLSVAPNGNPQLTVTSSITGKQHPKIAPIAMPGKEFRTDTDAQLYAGALLEAAGVITALHRASLVWTRIGYTNTDNGEQRAAFSARLPDADAQVVFVLMHTVMYEHSRVVGVFPSLAKAKATTELKFTEESAPGGVPTWTTETAQSSDSSDLYYLTITAHLVAS